MRCPECGAEAVAGYRFCGRCGARLRERPAAPGGRPHPVIAEPVAAGADAESVRSDESTSDGPGRRGRSGRLVAAVLVLLVGATGVVWLSQDGPIDPATSGHADATRNGVYEPPAGVDLAAVRWRRDQIATAYGPLGRPVVADGAAYVTSRSAIAAVRITDGRLAWRAEIPEAGIPAVDDRHVYVRAAGRLYALDRGDGALVWSSPFAHPPFDVAAGVPPLEVDGIVIAATPEGGLRAWSPDGEDRWALGADLLAASNGSVVRMFGGMVQAGDNVVATVMGSAGTSVATAIDPVDGEVVWTAEVAAIPAHPPLTVGGVVVFVGPDTLVAHDLRTGLPRWTAEVPLDTAGEPLVVTVGGNLAAVTADGELVLLDWFDRDRTELGAWQGAPPVTMSAAGHLTGRASGGLLVHTTDGDLVRFDVTDAAVRWRVSLGVGEAASASGGSVVVAPTQEGSLVGVDTRTGEVQWRTPIRGEVECRLSGGGDLTFLATDEGSLNAFHTAEGTVAWSHDDGRINGPVVAEEHEVIALDSGVVRFLAAASGDVDASATGGGGADPGLAVAPGQVVVAGRNGAGFGAGIAWVRAVDRTTQRSRWLAYVDEWLAAPVTQTADAVVAVTERGSVVALDAVTGEERWRHALAAPPAGSAVGAGTSVFVQDLSGHLTALALSDGAVRWSRRIGAPLEGIPVVAGDLVVSRVGGSTVAAHDATSGRPIWEALSDVEVTSAPSVAGELVYVGTASGLTLLDLATGEVVEAIELGAPVVAPPVVGADGVVVCLASGSVLALGR